MDGCSSINVSYVKLNDSVVKIFYILPYGTIHLILPIIEKVLLKPPTIITHCLFLTVILSDFVFIIMKSSLRILLVLTSTFSDVNRATHACL